ncbi:hypothetical protein BVY04_04110, partial [bacterium M21]
MIAYFQPNERFIALAIKSDRDGRGSTQGMELELCRRIGDELVAVSSVAPGGQELVDVLGEADDELVFLSCDTADDRTRLREFDEDRLHCALLDIRRLVEICFPMTVDVELATLLGPSASQAEQLLLLWEKCLLELCKIPLEVIDAQLALIGGYRSNPLTILLRAVRSERDAKRGSRIRLGSLFPVAKRPRRKRPGDDENEDFELPPRTLDVESTVAILDEGGAFASNLPGYEQRPQQLMMARAVCQAFRNQQHLMVEAGTGIGKSFAYLVPAVRWALENQTAVVVSTNTKNLQAQLFEKDLPLLQKVLGEEFNAAMIKGRRNYLCIRRLIYLLQNPTNELDRAERMDMLRVVAWSVQTASGDVGECCSSGAGTRNGIASRITTVAEDCSGRACRFYRQCFLYTARARSLAADVVVANHAVVFAEMSLPVQSAVIPQYDHIIFDEVHNLEDAATSGFAKELSAARLAYVLSRLCRVKRKKMQGLIPSLLDYVEKQRKIPEETKEAIGELGQSVMALVKETGSFITPFFSALTCVLEDKDGRLRESVRLRPFHYESEEWKPVLEISKSLRGVLRLVGQCGTDLADELGDLTPDMGEQIFEFAQEVKAVSLWLSEFSKDMRFILDQGDENYVCWVERVPGQMRSARAWAAPIDVGQILNNELYQEKDTVVFTSATLAVKGSAEFMKGRLGANLIPPGRLVELGIGTPFDYPSQCLAMIPTFLSEPGSQEGNYTDELGRLMANVFRQTQGRAMALFTSYDML